MTLTEVLKELAGRSDDVEAVIAAAGVKGWRSRPCECPVARYIAARLGLPGKHVTVGQDVVTVFMNGVRLSRFVPRGLSWFVRRFDRGDFPHLIDTEVSA